MSDNMNIEENRLRTFQSWPSNASVHPERLARGGFFATGNYLETQCNWCHRKISDWQYGDQTMVRHRVLDPLCPFVVDPTNCGNVPISNSSTQQSSSDQQPSQATSTSGTSAVDSAQIDYKNELCRLQTFKNWPNPNISPMSLAKAGFYYINQFDQVRCAWCKGMIEKWEKDDNAFEEHQRFFPDCPRVQLGPLIEIASDGIQNLGIQQICPPKRSKFSSLDARMRTYSNWPIPEIQKPEILSQAGFYYHNIDDQVRCFHCNGGLRSWQKEDDPWFEHAKWFPYCQFVKLVKGPTYVANVQEARRQACPESSLREAVSESNPDQVMTLDEAMLTDPVRIALEMGLNEGRVRNATRRQLEWCGKPYDTPEELVEAVLEGQTDEEEEEEGVEQSSSIVREVSRILNTIFSPRSQIGDQPSEEYSYSDQNASHHLPNSSVSQENAPTTSMCSPNITCTAPGTAPSTSTYSPMAASTSASSSALASVAKSELKQQISLEEENRKLKDARLCKVCMDDEVGVVFLPCGHLVTCVQCAPGVNQCPLCRSTIKGFVRTFLS